MEKYGNRTAVVSKHQRTSLTYEQLDWRSNALARGLMEKGVRKGERVAISLGNGVEFAVVGNGIWRGRKGEG